MFLHQPVKYTQYVDNVTEYQYKEHLPDVAQSFWDIHGLKANIILHHPVAKRTHCLLLSMISVSHQ